MAYVICDICNNQSKDVVCRRCYDELKDELDIAQAKLEITERELDELKETK